MRQRKNTLKEETTAETTAEREVLSPVTVINALEFGKHQNLGSPGPESPHTGGGHLGHLETSVEC